MLGQPSSSTDPVSFKDTPTGVLAFVQGDFISFVAEIVIIIIIIMTIIIIIIIII